MNTTIKLLKDAEKILAEIHKDSNIFYEIGRAEGCIQCALIHIECVLSKQEAA